MRVLSIFLASLLCVYAAPALANPKLENAECQSRFAVIRVPVHQGVDIVEQRRQLVLDTPFVEWPQYELTYRQILGDNIGSEELAAAVNLLHHGTSVLHRLPLMLAACAQVNQWATITPMLWLGCAAWYAGASLKDLGFRVWVEKSMDLDAPPVRVLEKVLHSRKFLVAQTMYLVFGAMFLYLGAYRS